MGRDTDSRVKLSVWVRIAGGTIFTLLLVVPMLLPLFGVRLLAVNGGSMAPTFQPGDAVLVVRAGEADLRVGAVLLVGDPPNAYVHRVIEVQTVSPEPHDSTAANGAEGTRARLQGDANEVPDPGWVSAAEVTGRVAWHCGGAVAAVLTALTSLPGRVVLVLLLLGVVFVPLPGRSFGSKS